MSRLAEFRQLEQQLATQLAELEALCVPRLPSSRLRVPVK